MRLNSFQRQLIDNARTAAAKAAPCVLCGESHGFVADTQHGKAHHICAAYKSGGLDLPKWKRCAQCIGLGRIPISGAGPINPSGVTMDRWAPKCDVCKGKGTVPK